MNLFPVVTFDTIDNAWADEWLQCWGHYLGACDRPYGIQSFGLTLAGRVVAVAVSASTVVNGCGGFQRTECVELARLCAHPDHRDMTRVCLRLWRKLAADKWPHWRARGYVSYASSNRHTGDIYRFDGWRKYADVPGGKKVNHGVAVETDPKSVWVYDLPAVDAGLLRSPARSEGGQG